MIDRQNLRNWVRSAGEETFSRSGGPGGQNVNKVNTKVTLKIPVASIPGATEEEVRLIMENLGNRISRAGELIIQASESRSQVENRENAEVRAVSMIVNAAKRKKKRKPTGPNKKAKERRLRKKKVRGRRKELRRPPEPE